VSKPRPITKAGWAKIERSQKIALDRVKDRVLKTGFQNKTLSEWEKAKLGVLAAAELKEYREAEDADFYQSIKPHLLKACDLHDKEFLVQLGERLAREPVSLLDKFTDGRKGSVTKIERFFLQYWVKPWGEVPPLVFLTIDSLAKAVWCYTGSNKQTAWAVDKIRQNLGLLGTRRCKVKLNFRGKLSPHNVLPGQR
jgi:hypothetical protein